MVLTSRTRWIFAGLLVAILWSVGLSRLPGFDLDEALYRRVTDEMKMSGDWLEPTWDAENFYEKPPTFFWMILTASYLVDGGRAVPVSPLAARLPAFLASLFTVFLLCWCWPRLVRAARVDSGPSRLSSPYVPLLLYLSALFPSLASGTILIDPVLTGALTPLLVGISILYAEGDGHFPRVPRPWEWLTLGFFLTLAMSLKGLAGLVTPLLAVGLHVALSAFRARSLELPWRLAPIFIVGLVGGTMYYTFLYLAQGEPFGGEFFREFFVNQQFKRSHVPFDGHSGPWFYYLAFVLLAGGAFCALLGWAARDFRAMPSRLGPFPGWGFPVSWAVMNLVFFSAMSTKIPGYVWPLWPALVLTVAYLLLNRERGERIAPSPRGLCWGDIPRAVAIGAPVLVGAAMCTLAILPVTTWLKLVGDQRAREILFLVGEWPISVRIALLIVGLLFVTIPFGLRSPKRLVLGAFSMVVANLLLRVSLAPFVNEVMVAPWERLARAAAERVGEGSCLIYPNWPLNATVSLNFRVGRVRNCLPEDLPLTLSGIWESPGCPRRGQVELATDTYLRLCSEPAEQARLE